MCARMIGSDRLRTIVRGILSARPTADRVDVVRDQRIISPVVKPIDRTVESGAPKHVGVGVTGKLVSLTRSRLIDCDVKKKMYWPVKKRFEWLDSVTWARDGPRQ